MYNDTLKVANKIITDMDLVRIFEKMNDGIIENQKLCKQEIVQNEKYEREYQHWTVKDFEGKFKCRVNFYDDTSISFDNYNSFMSIYHCRLHEIKCIGLYYNYSYTIQNGKDYEHISQSINMDIYEDKMNIDVRLSSVDKKMDDVFQLIKDIILAAPVKYDRIVQKKDSIVNKVSFAKGAMPSVIFCTLLCLIPVIRNIFISSYIVYPIIVVFMSYMIGGTIFGGKLDKLYSTIVPDKKYAGYDTTNYKSIYKDDIEDYVKKSEILIGKNVDNLKNRKEIEAIETEYSKRIPMQIMIIVCLSVLFILIGLFF